MRLILTDLERQQTARTKTSKTTPTKTTLPQTTRTTTSQSEKVPSLSEPLIPSTPPNPPPAPLRSISAKEERTPHLHLRESGSIENAYLASKINCTSQQV